MTPRQQVMNYQPRADVAQVSAVDLADDEGDLTVWSIYLSPDATVVELGVLMFGLRNLGIEVGADPVEGQAGAFSLRPLDYATRAPTGREIVRILERGFPGRVPTILLKQAD